MRWWQRRRARLSSIAPGEDARRSTPDVVLPHRVTAPLREVVAAWTVGLAPSGQVVGRAAELLAQTEEPAVFLAIAVLPLAPPTEELTAAVTETFALADDAAALDHEALGLLALRWACAATAEGRMTPQDLCRWAHGYSFWSGPPAFSAFEVLCGEFDDAEYADGLPDAELDERALAAAGAFLNQPHGLVQL